MSTDRPDPTAGENQPDVDQATRAATQATQAASRAAQAAADATEATAQEQEEPSRGEVPEQPRFGRPGLPVNRGHPFYVGFMGATGVLTAYWLLGLLGQLSSVITLLVVALFLALGLEPVVGALERRGLRRGLAVTVVFVAVIAVFAGFVSAVVPAVVTQGSELTKAAPDLITSFQNSGIVRRLDRDYGLISSITSQLQTRLRNGDTVVQLFGGVYGAGAAVVSGTFSTFTVLVLTLYFTASLRGMTEAAYRLVPASRRPRVRLLADEIIRRIGGYIGGQVAVASINGFFTFVLLSVLGLPYPLVLAITVAIFGLIPLVGATLGAIIVIVVALFHSWQTAVIALIWYLIYQQVENYLIAPRIMARTVSVPGAVAVVAALAGGTLLGVVGALIAIPVAAGVLLLMQEVLIPRQARH
jgi:predicted PurR-regulated permease PerM